MNEFSCMWNLQKLSSQKLKVEQWLLWDNNWENGEILMISSDDVTYSMGGDRYNNLFYCGNHSIIYTHI